MNHISILYAIVCQFRIKRLCVYRLGKRREKSTSRKYMGEGGRMRDPHTHLSEREKKRGWRMGGRRGEHPLFYIRLTHEC